jgi:acetyl esterase/lipase
MPAYRIQPGLERALVTRPRAAGQDYASFRASRTADLMAFAPADLTGLQVRTLEVPAEPDGSAPAVALRMYDPRPTGSGPTPCLVSIYGGGFMVGSVDDEAARDASWARELGIPVVAVTYRLAPEHPYPAAHLDCYRGYRWLVEHADDLAIDVTRIALYGISAGGALAVSICLHALEDGIAVPTFQFLSVPVLDDRATTASARRFADTPQWNRPASIASWRAYLGPELSDRYADVPAYAAPARATDVSRLPDTYISVVEFDPLRDEGIEFAMRLLAAGVSVELHLFPGAFHCSYRAADVSVSRRELREQVDVFRERLGLA